MKNIYLLKDIKSKDIAIVFAADNDEVAKRTIISTVATLKKNNDLIALGIWHDCVLQKAKVEVCEDVLGIDLSSLVENDIK